MIGRNKHDDDDDKRFEQQSYQKPEASNFPPMTFGGLPHIGALGFFLNKCFCLLAPLNTRYLPSCKECIFTNCS